MGSQFTLLFVHTTDDRLGVPDGFPKWAITLSSCCLSTQTIEMTVVFTSRNVVLPGCDNPQPATFKVDTLTGKILDVQHGYIERKDSARDKGVAWIDAGSNYILPGLVE